MERCAQDGEMMTVVLTADTPANTALLVGDKLVVTTKGGVVGDEIECHTTKVFSFKANGAIGQGKKVKYDAVNKEVSLSEEGEPVHGYAFAAAVGGFVDVKIG